MEEIELTGELKGWKDYINRKNEIRLFATIVMNGNWRRIEITELREREKMGGKDGIHKINLQWKT